MEETNTQNPKAGRGLGIAGFVVSLVAIILWIPISAAAVLAAAFGGGMGIAMFLLVLSLVGLVLSILGFVKANKAGAKKGLAIAGLVIGLVVTALAFSTINGVNNARTEFEKMGLGDKALETFKEGMEQGLDSLTNQLKEIGDSAAAAHE
jgi:hypothetical protein